MASGGNPFFLNKQNGPQNQDQGQSGGSTKGIPPQFLNRGKNKKKKGNAKGRQDALARRLANMKR